MRATGMPATDPNWLVYAWVQLNIALTSQMLE